MPAPFAQALPFDAILELPAQNTRILTVNNRLSRGLTSRYGRALKGRSAPLPSIQPWNSWLAQCEFDLTFSKSEPHCSIQVIDATIARMLWTEIIVQSGEHDELRGLIDAGQLAALAAQADEIALHWKVVVDSAWTTPEYLQFSAWQRAYQERLRDRSALDRTRVALQVPNWIRQGRVKLPENLVLAGFSQYSPAMKDVLLACQDCGVSVYEYQPDVSVSLPAPRQVRSATPAQQWQQAIDWAKRALDGDATGRYAIVVPDLQGHADQARRLIHAALGADQAFNVAVAPPLAQWPAARAMLAWLKIVGGLSMDGQVAVELAGQALLAGHCAGDLQERGQRALIDVKWRQSQRIGVSSDDWRQFIEPLGQLHQAWGHAQALWTSISATDQLAWETWSSLFRQTLVETGFPGGQAQTSVGFQSVQALDVLLTRLAGLDDFFEPVTWRQALNRLQALASQTLFQPQRDSAARLDVLGLLEAEGGQWDGVWVMGLTDAVLPAAVSPNPLLPRQALAAAQAPRSTPEREREWAARTFEGLCQLAPSVIMSWPARDDQQELRASPLLNHLPVWDPLAEQDDAAGAIELERWTDGTCPPLDPDELVSGGVAVLETQARNPMWAFVRYRLNTRALESYARVPSRSLRGTFLHAVMRALWDDLQSRQQMVEWLSSPGLDKHLTEIVQRLARLMLSEWPPALVVLEQQRTIQLVKDWLRLEERRPSFAKWELEFAHHLRFEQLILKVTLDRVDLQQQDAQDGLILIDYKTGTSCPDPKKDWDRSPPVELQMIAYARALKASKGEWPSAIIWAQLHPKKLQMSGICSPQVQLPGLTSGEFASHQDWVEQIEKWDAALERLAQQFEAGRAENVSLRRSDTRYCDIGDILRLHEEPGDE